MDVCLILCFLIAEKPADCANREGEITGLNYYFHELCVMVLDFEGVQL